MADPIQAATAYITAKLDTQGLFNTVTHSEMNDIAAKLKSLPAAQADAVIDNLARSGQLNKLASEAVDGSWFGNGGYSASEKRDFFVDMAKKLDGNSLATLSNAFAKTSSGLEGKDRVGELADAVASHGSAQAKLDYVKALAGSTADQKVVSSAGIGGSTMVDGDPEALAIAKVIGSMRGAAAEQAFKTLAPTQQRAVMTAAIDATAHVAASGHSAHMVMSWDVKAFDNLMTAAASVGDADLKARLFDAGVDTMRSVRDTNGVIGGSTVIGKDAALKSMTAGLTKIIDSDTTGVMRELTYNSTTRDGSDFAAYAQEMLKSGQAAGLGKQMAKLQLGNDLQQNPIDRLGVTSTVTGNNATRKENAGTLGYFMGGIDAALTSMKASNAEQREFTTAVIKSALTIVDKTAGRASPAVGIGASVAKEWVAIALKAAASDMTSNAETRLGRAALPDNPNTGELAVGDDVHNTFEAFRNKVRDLGKP